MARPLAAAALTVGKYASQGHGLFSDDIRHRHLHGDPLDCLVASYPEKLQLFSDRAMRSLHSRYEGRKLAAERWSAEKPHHLSVRVAERCSHQAMRGAASDQ